MKEIMTLHIQLHDTVSDGNRPDRSSPHHGRWSDDQDPRRQMLGATHGFLF